MPAISSADVISGLRIVRSLLIEYDGAIQDNSDPVAGTRWLPPTPETQAAARMVINTLAEAALDTLPFPIDLGALGSIDRDKVNAAVGKVITVLQSYLASTYRPAPLMSAPPPQA